MIHKQRKMIKNDKNNKNNKKSFIEQQIQLSILL